MHALWLLSRLIISNFVAFCRFVCLIVALSKLMQDEVGDTALISASQEGHINCATVLLKHKANVNYQRKVRLLYVHGQHD